MAATGSCTTSLSLKPHLEVETQTYIFPDWASVTFVRLKQIVQPAGIVHEAKRGFQSTTVQPHQNRLATRVVGTVNPVSEYCAD